MDLLKRPRFREVIDGHDVEPCPFDWRFEEPVATGAPVVHRQRPPRMADPTADHPVALAKPSA
eukprot:4444257-Alexandrium_andersonii.AAC.1